MANKLFFWCSEGSPRGKEGIRIGVSSPFHQQSLRFWDFYDSEEMGGRPLGTTFTRLECISHSCMEQKMVRRRRHTYAAEYERAQNESIVNDLHTSPHFFPCLICKYPNLHSNQIC